MLGVHSILVLHVTQAEPPLAVPQAVGALLPPALPDSPPVTPAKAGFRWHDQ